MTRHRFVLSAAALLAVAALPLRAQSLTLLAGGYVPGGNLSDVTTGAQNVAKTRDGTLGLGLDLDLGILRGSVAYASGTTIKNASRVNIGKGNVVGAAADLVLRPIPRILVQPYLIAGAGEKWYKFDQSTTLASGSDTQKFALHGGLGADVMLGPIGVVAELTDFLSRNSASTWNVNDAFLMVGLKLALGH